MGNDASLFCIDCNAKCHIGRAYQYNKEGMNRVLKEDTLDKLKIAMARFNSSIEQIEMFGEKYVIHSFEDIILFLEQHKGHKVYLIDDYFDEETKK